MRPLHSPAGARCCSTLLCPLGRTAVMFNTDGDQIFARLDDYARQIRSDHPNIDELTPRQIAVLVAEYLLQKGWTGISPGRDYHCMDHMFLGVALHGERRDSLPLISALIYSYVVRKFGLDAAP